MPGTYLTNGHELLKIKISPKYLLLSVNNIDQTRSQFCTCHDSWAVVACAKLWSDWIIRYEITVKSCFARFHLWAHKLLVFHIQLSFNLKSKMALIYGRDKFITALEYIWKDMGLYKPSNQTTLLPWNLCHTDFGSLYYIIHHGNKGLFNSDLICSLKKVYFILFQKLNSNLFQKRLNHTVSLRTDISYSIRSTMHINCDKMLMLFGFIETFSFGVINIFFGLANQVPRYSWSNWPFLIMSSDKGNVFYFINSHKTLKKQVYFVINTPHILFTHFGVVGNLVGGISVFTNRVNIISKFRSNDD